MKILADESVDFPIYQLLQDLGYDIKHVSFIAGGASDIDVLDLSYRQKECC